MQTFHCLSQAGQKTAWVGHGLNQRFCPQLDNIVRNYLYVMATAHTTTWNSLNWLARKISLSLTSHWTQPLDRSFFKSLKNRWNAEVSSFTQITSLPVGYVSFVYLAKHGKMLATLCNQEQVLSKWDISIQSGGNSRGGLQTHISVHHWIYATDDRSFCKKFYRT